MASRTKVIVVGGGLAGCEAAWQLAQRGFQVDLFEMRYTGRKQCGNKTTPAHVTGLLAELVCSNSLKSSEITNAHGLLKAELEILDSLILEAARSCAVPAGKALAVDRMAFAHLITDRIKNHNLIHIYAQEIFEVSSDNPTILATGPLTSEAMSKHLMELFGCQSLYFYDAIAPIVFGDSLDLSQIFRASRYGRGEDYLNLPLGRELYYRFVEELVHASRHQPHDFEKGFFYEGCLPIEIMAERDPDALRFGPLKPVGLVDPKTGRRPYAVVQLRQEDAHGQMYNLVGFQTRLAVGEQKRIFRLLPGMEKAEFARYGSMHRNTYLHSPGRLEATLQAKVQPNLFIAGQLCGVEGYMESTAAGLISGLSCALLLAGRDVSPPPQETMLGSLCRYISQGPLQGPFQPMNANFGLLPPLSEKVRDRRERHHALATRSLQAIRNWKRDTII